MAVERINMRFLDNKRKKKIFIGVISAVAVLAVVFVVGAIYVGDYYRADVSAIDAFAVETDITEKKLEDNILVYEPENATAGFIFYPGGKVEYTAYVPLMKACASEGIMCVLIEMPFNLAVLDMDAAEGITAQYPNIESWYIGGHSLGGSMAASYLADNTEAYDGLILLGAYSTADLSEASISVLSVYGSEDKVMNREKYDDNKANLPGDFMEAVIDGGCHAYFGMYGAQEGDGTPSVTNVEQIMLTSGYIVNMINNQNK